MKRLFFNLIIPIVALFAMAQTASAQWTFNLTSVYLDAANASKKIGIGTTAPTQKLHLVGGNMLLDYANGLGGGSNLYFGGVTNSSQNGMRMSYYNSPGVGFKNGYIDVRTTGGTANDGLLFRVDGGIGSAERMRIRADNGNVGIGTAPLGTAGPSTRLHVHNTAGASNIIANFSDSQGRHIFFVPKLAVGGYTFASKVDDAGIFWSDNTGWNNTAGFVIAPQRGDWAGIRLGHDGSSSLPGYRTTIGYSNSSLSLGTAAGSGLNFGTSYIGFNAARNKLGNLFTFETDGANNGGDVVWGEVGGRIRFATEPSTGGFVKTLNEAQIFARTKMSIGPDGKVSIGDDTNNGTLDINLGQIASGEGIGSKRTPGGNQWGLDFYTAGANRMRIDNNGKVVIGPLGTTTPGIYGLYVRDGILTEKVRVSVHGTLNWADYVFAPDYKLKPLAEVEAFVKANQHLPEVPSAQSLVENGLDLAEMQAKQMEKIEELTLYLIEINKRLEKVEAENASLKQQLSTTKN